MPVADRLSVARLDAPRRAIDPGRADAEPEIDTLIAEICLGPQRQAVDIHLALEKGLRQRRALIGQVLFVGEQDDLAAEAVLAQAGGGLNAGVAGAGDDDRERRHLGIHGSSSFAGVETVVAPLVLRMTFTGSRIVRRHRRRIDDNSRSRRRSGGDWRRAPRRFGAGDRRGGRASGGRRSRGSGGWGSGRDRRRRRRGRRSIGRGSARAAMRSSGVRQTRASSAPEGETGDQRSLMKASATHALSRGARAARASHSRTAP